MHETADSSSAKVGRLYEGLVRTAWEQDITGELVGFILVGVDVVNRGRFCTVDELAATRARDQVPSLAEPRESELIVDLVPPAQLNHRLRTDPARPHP